MSRYAPFVGNMIVNAFNILVFKVLFGALEQVLISQFTVRMFTIAQLITKPQKRSKNNLMVKRAKKKDNLSEIFILTCM